MFTPLSPTDAALLEPPVAAVYSLLLPTIDALPGLDTRASNVEIAWDDNVYPDAVAMAHFSLRALNRAWPPLNLTIGTTPFGAMAWVTPAPRGWGQRRVWEAGGMWDRGHWIPALGWSESGDIDFDAERCAGEIAAFLADWTSGAYDLQVTLAGETPIECRLSRNGEVMWSKRRRVFAWWKPRSLEVYGPFNPDASRGSPCTTPRRA